MNAEDIAHYLQHNPRFFEDHAELFSQIVIPHPHGGRAISITERQILTLREKCRVLENRLADLLRFGEENDAISEKMHRLASGLLAARETPEILRTLYFHLREDFEVPHVALRLWPANPVIFDMPEFSPVAADVRAHAGELKQPRCGTPAGGPGQAALAWFGEAQPHVRSVAEVPVVGRGGCTGLLLLGSEDAKRFYPEMGTLFLRRLGEMLGAVLGRELE